jgi:hypothetical protein
MEGQMRGIYYTFVYSMYRVKCEKTSGLVWFQILVPRRVRSLPVDQRRLVSSF